MEESASFLDICFYGLDVIVTFAFCVFLFGFLRQRDKTYGLYIIIILNLAYLSNGFYEIFRPFLLTKAEILEMVDLTFRGIYDFSMYWAAAFACFTHLVLNSRTHFYFKRFMAVSLLLCSTASAVFPLTLVFEFQGIGAKYHSSGEIYPDPEKVVTMKQKMIFFLLDSVSTTVIPVSITCYFYYRVYKTLQFIKATNFGKISSIRGHWFYMVPLICFMPSVIDDFLGTFCGRSYEYLSLTTQCMFRLWGVLTLWGFRFLKPAKNDNPPEEENPELRVSLQSTRRPLSKSSLKSSFLKTTTEDSFDANIL